jgi:predicted TIM-barrel fold metal-dependent hydrolase
MESKNIMEIIDAHHHLWCPDSDSLGIEYVWLKNIGAIKPFGDPTAIQRDYLAPEFQDESQHHQIIGSIHVQADGAIADPVIESLWLEEHSLANQLPLVHIGFLDLSANTTIVEKTLHRYLALPNFRGVRQILSKLSDNPSISFTKEKYLENPQWRENFTLLAKHRLSFDLQLYPEQMQSAANFLAQYPTVPIAIDHAGSPYDQTEQGLQGWTTAMQHLAALPNCHVKLSGFGMFDTNWSANSIQTLFDTLLAKFGVERMMFGSNYPVDKLMKSYDEVVDELLQCAKTSGLNHDQITLLFAENAKRFYHLDRH